jgi:hypothetical protein
VAADSVVEKITVAFEKNSKFLPARLFHLTKSGNVRDGPLKENTGGINA